MLLTQTCLPLLRRPRPASSHAQPSTSTSTSTAVAGGSDRTLVINTSSTRARQPEPNSETYATSQAGLLGLTHALAAALAPDGVSVNAILPGWIYVAHECQRADERDVIWEDGLSGAGHAWYWTGRVAYLVGAVGFVTGQEVVLDGGVGRRMVYSE